MLDFQRPNAAQKEQYEQLLFSCPERGCEYSFSNLFLWGRQNVAFVHGCAVFFSHFYGKSIYPYPIGPGDRKAAVEAILEDARQRDIPCRISGITEMDQAELSEWFPGKFHFHIVRDNFDYVYDIHALADLRGRKNQSKRNHFNRFCADHPDHQVVPITEALLPQLKQMVDAWYTHRRETDPHGDYLLENIAIARAFNHFSELGLEGIALMDDGEILAMTMGSRLSNDTFDIHFEKAREDVSGAYNAVNCQFARYLRLKYPEVLFLNREDDMGLEGLRSAKLSYHPHHMVEKYWAFLQEEIYEARISR